MIKSIFLKNRQEVKLRYPQIEDAQGLLDLILESVATSAHLLLAEGEIKNDLNAEITWLQGVLDDSNVVMLVALYNDKIVANAELRIKPLSKVKHWGELGITIKKEFRNLGLGTQLLSALITLGKEKGLESVRLSVFASNSQGIRLYEKLGFVKCGEISQAYKLKDGSYDSEIIMTKQLD